MCNHKLFELLWFVLKMHITMKNLVQSCMFKKCIYLDTKCLPVAIRCHSSSGRSNDKQQQQAAATTHHGGDKCDGRNDEEINNRIVIINRDYYCSDLCYFKFFWPVTAVVVALQWQRHRGKTDNNFWRAGTADLQGKAALSTILHSASVNCLIVGLFLVCGAMAMPIMVILSQQRPWLSSWSSSKKLKRRQTV